MTKIKPEGHIIYDPDDTQTPITREYAEQGIREGWLQQYRMMDDEGTVYHIYRLVSKPDNEFQGE